MAMRMQPLIFLVLLQVSFASMVFAETVSTDLPVKRPASTLLGEHLNYNVSFLWFDKIARGEIRFEPGQKKSTYLATLTASTRGLAAFFTGNRMETYTTLMEDGPDGMLRPLLQTSDTQEGKDGKVTHRQTSYTFDFAAKQVKYRKTINGVVEQSQELPMGAENPTYDFLTAFYNLRLGRLGQLVPGRDIKVSAFSRKGPEEIVISRLFADQQMRLEFSGNLLLCKVLMAPETFKTKVRDLYVGFDRELRPQMAVIKNIIGLGNVRGELVHATEPGRP